jgi:hypothetical protein
MLCKKRDCNKKIYSINNDGEQVSRDACDLIGNCKGGYRCGKCDIEYMKRQQQNRIDWWIREGKEKMEQREAKKAQKKQKNSGRMA